MWISLPDRVCDVDKVYFVLQYFQLSNFEIHALNASNCDYFFTLETQIFYLHNFLSEIKSQKLQKISPDFLLPQHHLMHLSYHQLSIPWKEMARFLF